MAVGRGRSVLARLVCTDGVGKRAKQVVGTMGGHLAGPARDHLHDLGGQRTGVRQKNHRARTRRARLRRLRWRHCGVTGERGQRTAKASRCPPPSEHVVVL